MTKPRSEIVDREVVGYYHCISRCVRRAFLCGYDSYSGVCYEHRKSWIRARLKQLCEIFAIECAAYAIMTNHLHTVLRIRPDIAAGWSDEEVARRWSRLFPGKIGLEELKIAEILDDPEKLQVYRERLSDLSWFKRCLNENLARRANAEDKCSGRFWQGRFKSQALKDEAAVLACSIYVDLNPVRAGIALTPEASDFTSVQVRIRKLKHSTKGISLAPALIPQQESTGVSERTYIELVEEAGRCMVDGKHHISPHLAPILERIGIRPKGLVLNVKNQGTLFKCVVGSVSTIREFAAKNGRQWYQGLSAAKRVFN